MNVWVCSTIPENAMHGGISNFSDGHEKGKEIFFVEDCFCALHFIHDVNNYFPC